MFKAKQKAPVVPIRQSIDWENTYQVCNLLREEIASAIRSGERIMRIAQRAGVSHGTISRMYYGETKEPRASTVVGLLRMFGYRITIS